MTARRHADPYAGGTDVGRSRSGNEDAYLLAPPLLAVADGLGGHQAGEIASGIAVDVLADQAPRAADPKALARAVRAANAAVIQAAESGRGRSGMGTTLTAAMLDGTRIVIAHVGDSRAYLLHLGTLQRLTEDHSMMADMIRQGTITEEDARHHPNRSVITRALGSDPNMLPDTYEVHASPGDRLLLCTDGLTSMVRDSDIERILGESETADQAVDRLISVANAAGGQDNITVVVAEIAPDPSGSGPARRETGAGRGWAARALWVLAALALIGGAAWGAYAYARSQAYVIDESGYLAVYEGVPGEFAGVSLHWRSTLTSVPTDALDPITAARLRVGVRAESLTDAYELIDEYRRRVEAASETTPGADQ
ncbi:MAG: hypothetical protein Kow0067_01470 [Coriobacteriia bacterium]